uniref:Uncharacterized protein n=1 Tax=Anguilla anguilla TaxID=7936 RepID=A0A0E9T1B1_ANGAN
MQFHDNHLLFDYNHLCLLTKVSAINPIL